AGRSGTSLGSPLRCRRHRHRVDSGESQGAEELTGLVGLQQNVRVIEGNVLQVPLPDASYDVVISQEALLHVPDKQRTLLEAFRILKPQGRIAFTDWVAHRWSQSGERPLR